MHIWHGYIGFPQEEKICADESFQKEEAFIPKGTLNPSFDYTKEVTVSLSDERTSHEQIVNSGGVALTSS